MKPFIPINACSFGNPIIPFTGVKLHAETDLELAGAHPLTLTRQYRSDAGGWMNNFQRSLAVNAIGTITATRPDASFTLFNPSGSNWQTNASSGANRKDTLTYTTAQSGNISAQTGYQYKVFETDAVEHYDIKGKLQKIVERNGWTTTLVYSTAAQISLTVPAAGLLIEVRNHFGRKIRFNYNAAKQITQTLDPAGNAINYAYNSAGLLTTVTWQDATNRTYHYENTSFTWALTGITDELGVRYATYGYDAQGRVNTETKVGNVDIANISYDSQGNTTVQHVSPTGTQLSSTTISMGLNGGNYQPTGSSTPSALCGGYAQTTTYDTAGNKLTELTHAGKHITYTYDAKSRETSRIERTASATGPITYKSVTQWHPTFNLPVWRSEPNRITAWTYDTLGQTTGHSETTQNDPNGTLGTAALVAQGDVRNTGWAYNAQRLPILATYVQNPYPTQTYTFTYDASGNLKTFTQPLPATASAPATTQTGYLTTYNANGAFTAGTSVTGQAVTHTYNARGKTATVTIAGQTTTYLYDAIGQDKKVTYPNGDRLDYTYSSAHVLTRITWNGTEIYPTYVVPFNPVSSISVGSKVTQYASNVAQMLGMTTEGAGINPFGKGGASVAKGGANGGSPPETAVAPVVVAIFNWAIRLGGAGAGAAAMRGASVANCGANFDSGDLLDGPPKDPWKPKVCLPGKDEDTCTKLYWDYQNAKTAAKGMSCNPTTSVADKAIRYGLNMDHAAKRLKHHDACFDGGDASHKREIDKALATAAKCR